MQSESVVDVRNDSTNKKTVTVLVPCFNEQESLPMLFDRMDALITQSKDLDYTLMFVDDGSTRIQFVSATLVFGLAAFDCSLAISSSHTSLGVL